MAVGLAKTIEKSSLNSQAHFYLRAFTLDGPSSDNSLPPNPHRFPFYLFHSSFHCSFLLSHFLPLFSPLPISPTLPLLLHLSFSSDFMLFEPSKKLYRIFQTRSFFIIRFLVTKKSEKPLYLLNIWAVFRGLLHFAMKNPFSFKCYL